MTAVVTRNVLGHTAQALILLMHRLPIRTPSGSQVLDTATCEFVPAEPEAPILHSDAHSNLRGTSVRVMYPSLTDLISVLPPPNATIRDLSAIVGAKLPGGAVNQLGFRSQDGGGYSKDEISKIEGEDTEAASDAKEEELTLPSVGSGDFENDAPVPGDVPEPQDVEAIEQQDMGMSPVESPSDMGGSDLSPPEGEEAP